MSHGVVRRSANVLAFAVMVVVNGLANALPLNGQTTGQISDRFAIYFVPAGYVFGIWGVIYLGLLGFVIYQALPSQADNPRLGSLGYLFVLSCVANVVWLFLWHYEQFALTIVAMLTLLLSLIASYVALGIGKVGVSATERWLVSVPFGVYLGWVSVATIANASQLLYFVGWDGWGLGAEWWAVVMLIAAVVIGGLMALTRRDVAFLLVLVWAFVGIAVKQSATPIVATVASAAAVLTALMVVLVLAGRSGMRVGQRAA